MELGLHLPSNRPEGKGIIASLLARWRLPAQATEEQGHPFGGLLSRRSQSKPFQTAAAGADSEGHSKWRRWEWKIASSVGLGCNSGGIRRGVSMQFKHSQSDTVMSCDDILRARRHGLTDKPASPPRNEDFLPTFIAIRSMNIILQYQYDRRLCSVVCCAETRLGHHILSLIHVILRT